MYATCGACPKCGAPIYTYAGPWLSILPPPPVFTCNCVPHGTITTTSTSWELAEV